jgi:two-component sensor histidine kinase
MQISDNGVGKGGTIIATGFGGQLISLFTQQLGGTMREENNNGTHIFFEFRSVKAA